jgi:hypothetical protein
MRLLIYLVIGLVITISGWITTYRLRKRMRLALGRDVTSAELTSISTWMEVEDQEERRRGYTSSTVDHQ